MRLLFLALLFTQFFFGQQSWLKPADSLNQTRFKTVIITEAALATSSLIALQTVWYSDYEQAKFHFVDDNAHWLQVDKAGHAFSAYHLAAFGTDLVKWSGGSKCQQERYGSTLGLAYLTAIEVMDGFFAEWGASWGDVAANTGGWALFFVQERLWKEQRIVPKFSWHRTNFAAQRPAALGTSISEQILKDYNGQTYWLSMNLSAFIKVKQIPKWLNIAVGYGGTNMLAATQNAQNDLGFGDLRQQRQFYLALDVDLTKIPTKSLFLKTVFSVFNTLKIPAPTLRFSEGSRAKGYAFYF